MTQKHIERKQLENTFQNWKEQQMNQQTRKNWHINELNANLVVYSRGLLVVIGNVDNVDGLSLRVFVDAIN